MNRPAIDDKDKQAWQAERPDESRRTTTGRPMPNGHRKILRDIAAQGRTAGDRLARGGYWLRYVPPL
jgi:hypothetical protein